MSRFATIQLDPGLLGQLRRGDRKGFARLYDLFSVPVFGLALRLLNDKEAAAEVAHDTFIAVFEGADSVRDEGAFGAWVRRITVNACLSQLRSPWVRRREAEVPEPGDAGLTTTRMNGWHDLERALGALAPESRFVVWMHEVEGYTHAELARMLGRSESYSKSQLARALVRLRAGGQTTNGTSRGVGAK